jgi:cytoskeletal protein RodZ
VSARQAKLRGGVGVLAVCALGAMSLAVQSANADPTPEAPPPSHAVSSPQPSSPPGAASSKTTSTATSAATSGSHVSTSTPSVPRVVVTTPFAHTRASAPSTPSARARGHTAPVRAYAPPPKRDLAPLFELRDLAGLDVLPSAANSGSSGLLLVAGFALVLLVIAETSFLGLAGSRFGPGGARAPSKRRPAEEPVTIRRVQLRR